MSGEWPAERLTALAVTWLRAHRPDALIVPEFVCGAMGQARIDLVAITKDGIFGVEVKGDGDTPARLPSQGPLFSAVCSTVHLLASPTHEEKFQAKRPQHWAALRVEDEGALRGDFNYTHLRDYFLAPQCLLNTLWGEELRRVCSRLRVGVGKRARVMDMIREITDLVPLRDIKSVVCEALLSRAWKGWNANGEGRKLFPPECDAPVVIAEQPQRAFL